MTNLSPVDRAVSLRQLRRELYLGGYTQTLEADDKTLRAALRRISPDGDIRAIVAVVGADAWAEASRILNEDATQ